MSDQKEIKKQEKFSAIKFIKGFNIFSPIWLAKALSDTFKIVIVFGLIFGITFGFGYLRGKRTQPVVLGYKDFEVQIIGEDGKRHKIEVKNHILYFDKKMVRVSDVPKLKPYGVGIKPKVFMGIGKEGLEPGLGAQVAYYKKFSVDIFGTIKKSVYIGISRDIDFKDYIKNSSIGIAIGTKLDNLLNKNRQDIRFLVYWSWKF